VCLTTNALMLPLNAPTLTDVNSSCGRKSCAERKKWRIRFDCSFVCSSCRKKQLRQKLSLCVLQGNCIRRTTSMVHNHAVSRHRHPDETTLTISRRRRHEAARGRVSRDHRRGGPIPARGMVALSLLLPL